MKLLLSHYKNNREPLMTGGRLQVTAHDTRLCKNKGVTRSEFDIMKHLMLITVVKREGVSKGCYHKVLHLFT